jgi:hypothetical protein
MLTGVGVKRGGASLGSPGRGAADAYAVPPSGGDLLYLLKALADARRFKEELPCDVRQRSLLFGGDAFNRLAHLFGDFSRQHDPALSCVFSFVSHNAPTLP